MTMTSQPLGFLIVDVARLLRRNLDSALAEASLGLTAGEARTLLRCERYGGATGLRQSVLAELMTVEPMTLVGYIDRLERAGLVGRFPDPADRRAKLIRTLPAATPVVERIAEIAASVRESATRGLPEEQIALMRGALEHMCQRLADGN
ncbi:MarR family winged helix-turn-helix transcriptional regulator [Methylobrevis pamukkalensis]|uniref:Transcriptional regulator SlyA n=1 Tax=Methylobrevis pamukkalensis TaxID=1439726 RepID=A0A1E3H1Y2_9HYPH|nr:MarR family transcriptional regulator [Methylobrevis pamukkalensis]ODN70304.1 Transcriptional regulator SlyA [Methylobrevis pamukkalensis]